jgi:hypothetical protein
MLCPVVLCAVLLYAVLFFVVVVVVYFFSSVQFFNCKSGSQLFNSLRFLITCDDYSLCTDLP